MPHAWVGAIGGLRGKGFFVGDVADPKPRRRRGNKEEKEKEEEEGTPPWLSGMEVHSLSQASGLCSIFDSIDSCPLLLARLNPR